MHMTTVYVEPQDILNNLLEGHKERFNKCVFTDAEKMKDGTVNITCLLINDKEEDTMDTEYRYKLTSLNASEKSEESDATEESEESKETEVTTEDAEA